MASLKVIGTVKLVEYDAVSGREKRRWEVQNTVTSGGLSMLRDYLIARNPGLAPVPPLYVAMGSGLNVPIGRFHTRVPGESYRTEVVSADPSGLAAVFSFFLGRDDNSGHSIAAYGLYAGAATAAANSGTLFAIVAEDVPFGKDSTSTYSGDWIITMSGSLEA